MPSLPAFLKIRADEGSGQVKLSYLFLLGFIASSVALLGLFWFFAAYETREALPLAPHVPRLSQNQLFDIIRNTVTAAAALGVGITLFFSYRRQQTAEETQRIGAEAQRTAAKAQETAASALELSNKQHSLDQQRRHDAITSGLRDRYSKAAEQLGSGHMAVRLAGVYSLAALADDWAENGNEDERQVCIDLLCAYFRSHSDETAATRKELVDATVQVVQGRITNPADQRKNWCSTRINLVRPGLLPVLGPVRLEGAGVLTIQEALVVRRRIRGVYINGGQFKIQKLRGVRRLLGIVDGYVKGGGRIEVTLQDRSEELPKQQVQPTIVFQGLLVEQGTIQVAASGAHVMFTRCIFEDGAVLELDASRAHENDHRGKVTFNNCTFKTNVFGDAANWTEGDEEIAMSTDELVVDEHTTFADGVPSLQSFPRPA